MNDIKQVDISTVMKTKYLDYAMSVIVGRALPDVRDGLKWVHRRSIYDMNELKLFPDTSYRKSARIVGDVLGKYHPHGDTSVYDAIVRMSQDFSMRYPLVDGHGNWGSIDGDSAAAMRYTEMRMHKITGELLKDINKDTVDFIPNFDGEETEPSVLPSRLPNLLVNGTEGIAVGVATNIPPHNLSDSIDATITLIKNPNSTVADLVHILKAPDFPTGGEILNPNEMLNVYENGQGKIIMRAKYHIETNDNKESIIITEIPYQINKSKLSESVYNLSNPTKKTEKGREVISKPKIEGIQTVVDESDREGMRLAINLKKNVKAKNILPLLFKYSKLECNYNANFTAIINKKDKTMLLEHLNLKELINYYIEHQKEVLLRRANFDFQKAEKRVHILEALTKATKDIDTTISTIRNSKDKNEAIINLKDLLSIDEEQCLAILSLKLQRLTSLELDTLNKELDDLTLDMISFKKVIDNPGELNNLLITELLEVKEKYGDPRKTKIVHEDDIIQVSELDIVEDYNCQVTLSRDGYFKKIPLTSLRTDTQLKLKDGDTIIYRENTTNKSTGLIFTSLGNCYKLYLHQLEVMKPAQLGVYLPQELQLERGETILGMVATTDYKEDLFFCFENGKIARVDSKSFETKQMQGKLKKAINTDSPIVNLFKLSNNEDIVCLSDNNKVLVINSSKINTKVSRNTQGVQILKEKIYKNAINKMILADKISSVNIENIKDIEYYRVNNAATGKYLKKDDYLQQL